MTDHTINVPGIGEVPWMILFEEGEWDVGDQVLIDLTDARMLGNVLPTE